MIKKVNELRDFMNFMGQEKLINLEILKREKLGNLGNVLNYKI